MKNWSKFLALALAFIMVFTMTACNTSAETNEIEEVVLDTESPINVMVLNGTTGFGMAKLITDANNGTTDLNYNFSVETDASNVTAALINGSVDIAALPTNAASVVYNKTQGAVQVLALNTLGVLYLVTDDSVSVDSMDDLRGLTVYAPAQNPSFILSYLLESNGLTVGEDVVIDNTYAQPADLRTAVAAGEVSVAVLPEPMLTIAKSSNDKLVTALDLTEEWDKVSEPGSLVQGCVVVRKEFAEAHPNEISAFLNDYAASISYLTEEGADVAGVIETSGIFAKGAVAAKALPNCNLCFITGN
ncbi:MAG: ABC transporter substrate-binding protein, partial [Oscillospiraceae bacterium]|nr:ABC transporter substrate-binding protein [Oscillospiraceae bacterium]